MFELVGKIVLILCGALQTGNAALKIVDLRPALRPCDGSVVDMRGGRLPRPNAAFLQIERKILKIPFAVDIALVGSQLVPGQGLGIVRLHAVPVLIHPAELICRVAVPVRRSRIRIQIAQNQRAVCFRTCSLQEGTIPPRIEPSPALNPKLPQMMVQMLIHQLVGSLMN